LRLRTEAGQPAQLNQYQSRRVTYPDCTVKSLMVEFGLRQPDEPDSAPRQPRDQRRASFVAKVSGMATACFD
jgi:hypothetical protein